MEEAAEAAQGLVDARKALQDRSFRVSSLGFRV